MTDWNLLTPVLLSEVGGDGDLGVIAMVLRASFVVQLVLVLLLAMSVLTWAVIFHKWRLFRRSQAEDRRFHKIFMTQGKMSLIHQATEGLPDSPVGAIFRTGYQELVKVMKARPGAAAASPQDPDVLTTEVEGIDNVSRALTKATESELSRLERGLPFLATTGSTAPFIGLFGTVWGIMNAFRNIGLAGSASLASVAPGISEALVATAGGLAAAIPSVVAYNYYVQRIRLMENDMRTFSAEFLNIIERHFRKRS